MPRTNYGGRRGMVTNGGGNRGLIDLLGNILGEGETTDINRSVGQDLYTTSQGDYTSQPFSDKRGFFAKAFGVPNRAEELNTGLASQRQEGKIKNQLGTEWLEASGPLEARNAARLTFAKDTGLPPELYDTFVTPMAERARATLGATTAEAGERTAKATTGRQIEEETRTPRRRIAQQEAQRGVNESTQRTLASGTKEAKTAQRGRYMAEQLTPAFNLERLATRSVSPGETQQFRSQGMGPDLERILGPGFNAFGQTSQEQPILGQPIGSSGLRAFLGMGRSTTPGSITPSFTMEDVNAFLGGQSQGTAPSPIGVPRATGEQFGPFMQAPPQLNLGGVGMPTMGAGGTLSAPYNPPQPQESPEQAILRKQREAQAAQELLRRLLNQGVPYTPNSRNF